MDYKMDFLSLDEELTKEEISLRAQVRAFGDSKVLPRIAELYEKQEFPKDLISEFAKFPVFGTSIQGYGCPGLNSVSYGLAMQEVERIDSGLRSFVSVQGALCMYPISKYASEDLKKKYLPEMAKGKLIGCFGLTEPEAGSNPASMTTHVRKEGGHYILNGHKRWLTNGGIADLLIVWAKDEEGKICGFIVDRALQGLEHHSLPLRLSLRASVSSEFKFKDVKIPATHKLDVSGLKGPFSCLNQARFGISWGVIGAAEFCFEKAREYALNRKQFDGPLASHQLVQAKLVQMYTDIQLMKLLVLRLAKLKDKNQLQPEQISMAKMNNVSKALGVARLARDILGGNGILGEHHVMRHMNNLETVNTYEGTEDIHRLVIGQYLTGIAAFR